MANWRGHGQDATSNSLVCSLPDMTMSELDDLGPFRPIPPNDPVNVMCDSRQLMNSKTEISGNSNFTFNRIGGSVTVNMPTNMEQDGNTKKTGTRTNQDESRPRLPLESRIPPVAYNIFLSKICEKIDAESGLVNKLKLYSRSPAGKPYEYGVPSTMLDHARDALKFIESLEQCDLLSPENFHFLQFLLCQAGATHISDDIAHFAEKQQYNCLYIKLQRESLVNGGATMKFHIEGDISAFTQLDANRYRNILAERLDIPPHLISIAGIEEGSLIIIFQVPRYWKGRNNVDFLCQQLQENALCLGIENLISVQVDEQIYKLSNSEGFQVPRICKGRNNDDDLLQPRRNIEKRRGIDHLNDCRQNDRDVVHRSLYTSSVYVLSAFIGMNLGLHYLWMLTAALSMLYALLGTVIWIKRYYDQVASTLLMFIEVLTRLYSESKWLVKNIWFIPFISVLLLIAVLFTGTSCTESTRYIIFLGPSCFLFSFAYIVLNRYKYNGGRHFSYLVLVTVHFFNLLNFVYLSIRLMRVTPWKSSVNGSNDLPDDLIRSFIVVAADAVLVMGEILFSLSLAIILVKIYDYGRINVVCVIFFPTYFYSLFELAYCLITLTVRSSMGETVLYLSNAPYDLTIDILRVASSSANVLIITFPMLIYYYYEPFPRNAQHAADFSIKEPRLYLFIFESMVISFLGIVFFNIFYMSTFTIVVIFPFLSLVLYNWLHLIICTCLNVVLGRTLVILSKNSVHKRMTLNLSENILIITSACEITWDVFQQVLQIRSLVNTPFQRNVIICRTFVEIINTILQTLLVILIRRKRRKRLFWFKYVLNVMFFINLVVCIERVFILSTSQYAVSLSFSVDAAIYDNHIVKNMVLLLFPLTILYRFHFALKTLDLLMNMNKGVP